MSEPILFDCEIRQVKTMADHSVNLTLNIPEYNNEAAAQLLRNILSFGRAAIQIEEEPDDQSSEQSEKKSNHVRRSTTYQKANV